MSEHRIFMTWRIVWTQPDPTTGRRQPKNLEQAQRDAHKLRSAGNVIDGCSFDAFVLSWDECPVCHHRGTNEGGERQGPHWADPFFRQVERERAHWQPRKRKAR